MLWELFSTFLMVGFVSFGGGYAMIPVIEAEVSSAGWLTTEAFTDVIAIAGMSPGPIATNIAILVGYETAGLTGAIVSALGMILPSLLIILLIGLLFQRIHQHRLIKSAFYGLRPIITGLIIYAAIHFALSNHLVGDLSLHTLSLVVIFMISFIMLSRFHVHPVFVISLAGIAGVIFYT